MLSYLLLGFLRRKAVLLMILKCYTPFQLEQNIGKNNYSKQDFLWRRLFRTHRFFTYLETLQSLKNII